MKNTYWVLIPSLLFGFMSAANANCVGPIVAGKCLSGTSVPGYGSDSGYTGSSGKKYDYDLSNPADKNRYSIDLDAQRRDQKAVNDSDRNSDRARNQYGGGSKPD